MPAAIICEAPYVIDGDSIRCANLGEIRLLGIDAADYRRSRPCTGHFGDHVCNDRSARLAKWSLAEGIKLGPVTVEQVTRDRYRRIVGLVSAGGNDMSCWQLQRGTVRYIVKYDNGGMIRSRCSEFAR